MSDPEPRGVVVWRHGRTSWNGQRRFQGRTDVPLDADGQAQACAAAAALASSRPARLLASDMARAQQTAEALARRVNVAVTPDSRLREIDIGDWEGLTRQQARERFPVEYARWRQGHDVRRGGGETLAEVGQRVAAMVTDELRQLAAGETLVVVTHGGSGRAVIGETLQLPTETWWRLATLGHARWALLTESTGGWRLRAYDVRSRPARCERSGDHNACR
jgi:broad specificity phosphatase PhoE